MIFQAVSDADPNAENRLYTVIEGPFAVEKLFVSGRKAVCSDASGFFAAHPGIADLRDEASGRIFSEDGTRVFGECLGLQKKLVICGAGFVSMPVIRIGKMLGFEVTVIDERERFAAQAGEAGADHVLCMPFEQALSGIPGSSGTFFVIVTRGHRYDKDCLRAISRKPSAYVGMMGSRRRVGMVKEDLAAEGVPAGFLDSVSMPIGLPIGADTPEEIAVSIFAEIIEKKNSSSKEGPLPKELLEALAGAEKAGGEAPMLLTIVSKRGSAPRKPGTRMLLYPDGTQVGTIGGGCAEAAMTAEAIRMMKNGTERTALRRVRMTAETAADEGMVCGGDLEVFLERIGG